MPGLLIVVSAPSGTGKTSICRQLMDLWPNLRFSVSYTTRPARAGEQEGKDYHFVSEEVFRQKIARGEFIEWVENYGYFYGTAEATIRSLMEEGRDLLVDVEPRGAKELKKSFPGAIFVFILPPTFAELKERLQKRGFDGEEAIQRRLNEAFAESREVVWYDYVIFNDDLEEAVCRLSAVYEAEQSRRERMMERIKVFLKQGEVNADWMQKR